MKNTEHINVDECGNDDQVIAKSDEQQKQQETSGGVHSNSNEAQEVKKRPSVRDVIGDEDDEETALKSIEKGEGKKVEGSFLTSWLRKKNKRKAAGQASGSEKRSKGKQFRVQQTLQRKDTELLTLLESPLEAMDFTSFPIDLLGSSLLPCDVVGLAEKTKVLKCLGDGNCLFNAMSILLCGEGERYPSQLRKLTCDFLESNLEYMAHHPAYESAAKALRRPEDFVFVQSLSMVTQKQVWDKKKNRQECLLKEAQICRHSKTHSSMLAFLALVEVVKRPVTSIYPNTNKAFRPLYHQRIMPLVVVEDKPLFLLWSKDNDLDAGKGVVYHANHIVPVVDA